MIADYRENGKIPPETPSLEAPGISVYGAVAALRAGGGAHRLSGAGRAGRLRGDPGLSEPLSRKPARRWSAFRLRLRERFGLPVTVGYGPRFLHSTGQLHKGDAGRGLFIQLTADDPRDAPIPDEIGLAGVVAHLRRPQGRRRPSATGRPCINAGRRVIRFHLHGDPVGGIKRLG